MREQIKGYQQIRWHDSHMAKRASWRNVLISVGIVYPGPGWHRLPGSPTEAIVSRFWSCLSDPSPPAHNVTRDKIQHISSATSLPCPYKVYGVVITRGAYVAYDFTAASKPNGSNIFRKTWLLHQLFGSVNPIVILMHLEHNRMVNH